MRCQLAFKIVWVLAIIMSLWVVIADVIPYVSEWVDWLDCIGDKQFCKGGDK